MSRKKMMPPLAESLGGSEQERFQRFTKAVLSVPKAEIMPTEEVLAKLEDEGRRVDAKIAKVRRTIMERNTVSSNRRSG